LVFGKVQRARTISCAVRFGGARALLWLTCGLLAAQALLAAGEAWASSRKALGAVDAARAGPAAPDAGAGVSDVLRVGPQRRIKSIAEAARIAKNGDIILIDAGVYRECAVWRASDLVIRGAQPGKVIVRGQACEGKALFVIKGDRTTVDGVTFAYAAVPDRNGAGIRQEGRDLTVRRSVFFRNQSGILTMGLPDGSLTIEDSRFLENGGCPDRCGHALYAGALRKLLVRRSIFKSTQDAHHIKSRAAETEIVDSVIEDGDAGNSSFLIDVPNGGAVTIRHNTLVKGPESANVLTAIRVGAEGVRHPTPYILVEDNRFANRMRLPTVFFWNDTQTRATLRNNQLDGLVLPSRGRRGPS
jgi:hypothetical protein